MIELKGILKSALCTLNEREEKNESEISELLGAEVETRILLNIVYKMEKNISLTDLERMVYTGAGIYSVKFVNRLFDTNKFAFLDNVPYPEYDKTLREFEDLVIEYNNPCNGCLNKGGCDMLGILDCNVLKRIKNISRIKL